MTCKICLNDDQSLFPLNNCTDSFCSDCLQDYINHSISEGERLLEIECPRCDQILGSKLLNDFDYDTSIPETQEDSFLICPTCKKQYARSGLNKIRCSDCRTDFCTICSEEHENDSYHSCPLLDRIHDICLHGAHPCPRCGILIEKIYGCDAMKCLHCKVQFVGLV
jgi:ssDNA-binding Zn-finger/Zn-ribbon topoisomerase 1